MTIGRILGTIGGLSCLGAVIGVLVGAAMGKWLPDFFSYILPEGPGDRLQVGIGLGLVNGLLFGFLTGLVIVLVQAFGKRRDP
ncbi:MAG TPA: hypothetical protein VM328_04185 [Fimbriimonadaceae bacterium]|nr:hypothetical protein [Fimbriimonadaceae bacterium]